MKTTTYAFIMTATTLLFAASTGYALYSMQKTGAASLDHLTECAKTNNVYACHYVAIPVEAPRVVIQQATLLPPPAL